MSQLEEDLLFQVRAAQLPEPAREYKFIADRRFRADFAWPGCKLLVEVEGGVWVRGRHTRPAGYSRDCEKYNLAALNGWAVLRFTGDMIADGRALAMIEQFIEPD